MTTSEEHPQTLGYLSDTIRQSWEQMEAAAKLRDRATYEANRAKFLDAEAKVWTLLPDA